MHIAIARSFRYPMAVNRYITSVTPMPVSTRPDIPRTRRRLHLDHPLGRWLRRDHFKIFMGRRSSFVDDSLFDAAGRHYQCRNQYPVT